MTDTVIEKREIPDWVAERIARLGGLNLYGRPNFRCIWGGNRTRLVGGMFNKVIQTRDDMIIGKVHTVVIPTAEMRTILSYHPFRWHLEKWLPPECYGSREEWYERTWDEESKLHVQGDYPTEGDYEHVFYLGMCRHMRPGDIEWCGPCKITMGEYIPLEENISLLERQIHELQLSAGVSAAEERAALFMREDKKRQAYRDIVGQRVRNAMRPKLIVQPSTLMDGLGHCKVPDPKLIDIRQPLGRSSFRQSQNFLPNKKQDELEKEN